jgi:hypothetical protein
MFEVDRDGFMLLAMNFTGSKAHVIKLGFIKAFNEMERQLLAGNARVIDDVHTDMWYFKESVNRMYENDLELRKQKKLIAEQAAKIDNHDGRILEVESKISSKNENYYTISGYMSKNKISLSASESFKSFGIRAAKLSKENGITILKEYDAKYGEVNSYDKNKLFFISSLDQNLKVAVLVMI